MNSSIAFKVAAAVTNAVAGTATVQAAEPQPNENLFYDAEDETNGQYALQAGSVIPATLQTGVSSDMPDGDVVALVRQNIYDSLTGTHLLIPQGSKIIGTYGQAGARGNKRIGVVFERIILPDGSSLELPDQKAIDGTGTPGLIDKYTTHSSTLFKTAFMTALLGAAAQSATGNTSGDDNRSPGQEAVAGAVAEVMETASNLIDRDANIAPTITISPGYQFNIFINQDLLIGEYVEEGCSLFLLPASCRCRPLDGDAEICTVDTLRYAISWHASATGWHNNTICALEIADLVRHVPRLRPRPF